MNTDGDSDYMSLIQTVQDRVSINIWRGSVEVSPQRQNISQAIKTEKLKNKRQDLLNNLKQIRGKNPTQINKDEYED